MNIVSFSLILAGVMLNAAAQILMKMGTNAVGHFEFSAQNIVRIGWKMGTEWHIVTALFCYAISVVVWILALSRVQVSIAYPMLSLGYVAVSFASWWLFAEPLTVTKLTGIGVIILGVVILYRA